MADIAVCIPVSPTPTSPDNGRMWVKSDGLRVQIASATKLLANVGTKPAFVLPVGTDMWATSAE